MKASFRSVGIGIVIGNRGDLGVHSDLQPFSLKALSSERMGRRTQDKKH